MKKYLLLIIPLCCVIASCKKSSNDSTCTLSETSIVGSYKITDITYKVSSSYPAIDIYNDTTYFPACRKDDLTIFTDANIVNYVDAGVTCSGNNNFSGTWTLTGTTITVPVPTTSGTEPKSGTISNFSCTGMTITVNNAETSGDQAAITYTKVTT